MKIKPALVLAFAIPLVIVCAGATWGFYWRIMQEYERDNHSEDPISLSSPQSLKALSEATGLSFAFGIPAGILGLGGCLVIQKCQRKSTNTNCDATEDK